MSLIERFTKSMPYIPAETAEASLPKGGGVYLLTDADDHLIQLAAAADIRRALRTRLLAPAEPAPGARPITRRANLSQIVRKIYWLPAHSVFELTFAFYQIARELMPEKYLKQLAFGPAWFVHVDPQASIPRFLPGKLLRSPPGMDLGPFPTQADATRYVEILEDAFDLCRYHHILEQVPHGQACAYFEMGKCPAPCDGTIPMTAYREMIQIALNFALGTREQIYAQWQTRMREAAREHAFERAGLLKQHWERAQRIEHDTFEHVRPIAEFNYLIVQRGGGQTRVKPFFIRSGQIKPGEPAKLKDMTQLAGQWVQQLEDRHQPAQTPQQISEQIWLVSHFLFKRDAPGLFLQENELESPAKLAEQIQSRFRPTKPTPSTGD